MNWNYLIYSIVLLALSFLIYLENKKWVKRKKERDEFGDVSKGLLVTKAWVLIVIFALAAIICFFKFLKTT